jgi:hypothetical protein
MGIIKIIQALFPSLNDDADSLYRNLVWVYRAYYVYLYIFFFLIEYKFDLLVINYNWLIVLFIGAFYFPFYIFQSYRSLFSILGATKKRFILRLFFFVWLVSILFFNIIHIMISAISARGVESRYDWALILVSLALWVSGELLFRKARQH